MTAPAANVFISYSHHDAPLVAPVVSLLRISRALVFRDADSIPPGKRWRGEIETAIDNAHVLVVFWCYHALDSDEVAIEYRRAISQGKDVVPLRLDDSPLPPELNDYQFIDFRGIPGFRHGAESKLDASSTETTGRSATASPVSPTPPSPAPTPSSAFPPSANRRVGAAVFAGIAILVTILAALGILSTDDLEAPPAMVEPPATVESPAMVEPPAMVVPPSTAKPPVTAEPEVPSAEFATPWLNTPVMLGGLALIVAMLWGAWSFLRHLLYRYREPAVRAEVPPEPDETVLHAQRNMAATIEFAVLERIKGHTSDG